MNVFFLPLLTLGASPLAWKVNAPEGSLRCTAHVGEVQRQVLLDCGRERFNLERPEDWGYLLTGGPLDLGFEDFNFDGHLDVRMLANPGNKAVGFDVFLFNPAKHSFIWNKALSSLPGISADRESRTLVSHFSAPLHDGDSTAAWPPVTVSYKVQGARLVEIERRTLVCQDGRNASNPPGANRCIASSFINAPCDVEVVQSRGIEVVELKCAAHSVRLQRRKGAVPLTNALEQIHVEDLNSDGFPDVRIAATTGERADDVFIFEPRPLDLTRTSAHR